MIIIKKPNISFCDGCDVPGKLIIVGSKLKYSYLLTCLPRHSTSVLVTLKNTYILM